MAQFQYVMKWNIFKISSFVFIFICYFFEKIYFVFGITSITITDLNPIDLNPTFFVFKIVLKRAADRPQMWLVTSD